MFTSYDIQSQSIRSLEEYSKYCYFLSLTSHERTNDELNETLKMKKIIYLSIYIVIISINQVNILYS